MKISLFLVFLIASSAFADSNNNQCLLNSGAPGTSCVTRDQCALNLGCVSGTCQFINLGKTCSANAECGGLYPFCIGGRCDAKRVPGDPCSMNEQCISGQCTGSICISKQLNEACGGSDCAPGLFCNPNTRVCSNKLAVNAVCSNEYVAMVNNVAFAHDLSVMCSDSALCDYSPATDTQAASGVCTPIFTSNQGTRCGAFGSFTCPIGSTCNSNNQCQALSGNDLKCASGAQCSGISTFCACENTNNQNLQVYQTTQTTTKGYTRQLGVSANAAGAGANVGTSGTGVSAAGQSANVGTQGANVQTGLGGANVGTQGAAVGVGQQGAAVGVGQQGAAVGVGQQGAAVGVGQQGAAVGVGQQGAAVGVGQQGAAVGVAGTTVAVSGGGVAINTANFQGICTTDNCYSSFAPDYYSCLLQNGCGLTTEPIFINGTCASSCAFLYSRLQCCQAGFTPIISSQSQGGNNNNNNNNGVSVSVNTNNNNNNNNNNNLQRSVALPPQIQCVGFQQPPPQALSAGTAVQVGVILVASLVGVLLF